MFVRPAPPPPPPAPRNGAISRSLSRSRYSLPPSFPSTEMTVLLAAGAKLPRDHISARSTIPEAPKTSINALDCENFILFHFDLILYYLF